MKTNSNKKYTYAVGRRRTSSARVRLFKGTGESMINGKPLNAFVGNSSRKLLIERPLIITETLEKYYFTAKVSGGGVISQINSVVHGLSRALVSVSKDKYNAVLKKAGLLTRDPRERQRRMVGKGGKSRRKKQSPKR